MSGNVTLYLQVIDSLVPSNLHQNLWSACMSKNWYFGHSSVDDGDVTASFWKMDLDHDDAASDVWNHVKPKVEDLIGGKGLEVLRQYANGHTYGLGGQPHVDDVEEGTYTLLYYPMLGWDTTWEGETLFFDERGDAFAAIQPRPNRAIFFDSRLSHTGRAPSRFFGGLRVTVAYKLKVADV